MVKKLREGLCARFIVVHGKRVLASAEDPPSIAWRSREEVLAAFPQMDEHSIYLGPAAAADGIPAHGLEVFAVDVTGAVSEADCGWSPPLRWINGRDLMLSSARDFDVSVAGMALAAAGWTETAQFDGRTGRPTLPTEGGMKRKVAESSSKVYPRTDPVAIALIASADRQKCLLVRTPKYPPKMYTCVSGFVDQCESVEEAICREACEETGVELASVELFASQPWPIGRAGSCELMIGCKAVARSSIIQINKGELEDARWFSREEVRQMLKQSHPEGFFVPGPFAIAHHLIRNFEEESRTPPLLAPGTRPFSEMLLGGGGGSGPQPLTALTAGVVGLLFGMVLAGGRSRF